MVRFVPCTLWLACAPWLVACGNGAGTRPDDKPHKTTTARVEEAKPKVEVSEAAQEAFRDAVADYKHQKKTGRFDYDSLIASFERALDQDPKLAEAHYNLGCIYEAKRKDKEAVEHYKKALKIRPDLTVAAANWGSILDRRGKDEQALLVYKRAMSKDASNSAVLLNMAGIYRRQKKSDLALKAASEVLTRDPGNVGAYRIMASVYYDRDDIDMAHLICLRGLQVKENDPRLLNTLGLVLLKLKRVPEALAKFRGALKQVPDMIPTRFNVAKIALDYKDFRVAKEEFDKILQYDPDNRKASIGLGIAMRGVGDFAAAKAHFAALGEKYGGDPEPHYWLGLLAEKNFNDMRMALTEYKAYAGLYKKRRDLPPGHPIFERIEMVKKQIQMEGKMKEMEKKMAVEAARQEKRMQQMAMRRKKIVDDDWARREKAQACLPPAKLNGAELPFVLVPLAVPPDKNTKVKITGMEFEPIKKVEIGTLKAKFRVVNETTIEMIAPKGLGLGAWDVMITFKDRNEDPMLFQGGLWVCKTPKKKKKPDMPKGKDKDKGKTEPGKKPGVQGGKAGDAGKGKAKGPEKKDKIPEPIEPEEPADPDEPGEPAP